MSPSPVLYSPYRLRQAEYQRKEKTLMSNIQISVDELYKLACELKEDGMYAVELTIIPDPDGNFVAFSACTKDEPYAGSDYDDIDELILSD